ncbi:hypothetical protein [Bradyrhizobium sp. JYMT SZCCT0428]|uniref:hypothetical protein n=1 Tax=Bradyrhizobium sp. JYMT SZCCT0428 TaxID=2807673 RepID=UPI001BA5B061|nr:hypothetical protein [Bradyrhizobium sp. JYMT SZCCT0428]MBR1154498.1 hypothetical protein [Bradyrhizobium sp. JYMT SZCCT0428]
MNEYRTYVIGDDGHIKSSRAFVCENDADAIVWAKQLVDGQDIELWSRDRLVKRLSSTTKPQAVSQPKE